MVDIALAYDATRQKCDVVFNGRDFALDATPASAMLFSLVVNRRAKPDDVVPTQVPDWRRPASFTARGGCPGDALDPNGQLSGSRLWLFWRRLADEQARLDCEAVVAEALDWLNTVRGLAVSIAVRYVAPQILGFRAVAGNTALQLKQAVG